MASIPTPPASRETSTAPENDLKETGEAVPSVETLSRSLDALLERYLGLLDRHQQLQADLGKQFSSGFLSLAHANYTCPPGRRYGADYYDERMKATRTISLKPTRYDDRSFETTSRETSSEEKHFEYALRIETSEETEDNEATPSREEPDSDTASRSSETDDITASQKGVLDEATHPETTIETAKSQRPANPITWYGVLVPPSLRRAQTSFTEAVEVSIPELASTVAEMQSVEAQVAQLRKQIGLP